MKSFISLVVVSLVLSAAVTEGRPDQGRGGGATGGAGGGGGMSVTDPTQFEQFVSKLKLNEKKQLPEVQKIFLDVAAEAAPIAQELTRLRTQMVAEYGKPDRLAPLEAAFNAASARMVAAELKAFAQVQALLKPDQLSKSADAFVLIAGIFNPPTPRSPSPMRRGGGGDQ